MAFRLQELAEAVGGRVRGDPERCVEGVATLEDAGPGELSFLTNRRYRREAESSRAGVLLVGPGLELERDLLICEDPYWALARVIALFHPPRRRAAGIHGSALVETGAEIDPSASVGPFAVVGAGSTVGAGAVLHAHVVVGRECVVGRDSELHPGVVLYDGTVIGERCTVHAGVVLGSDGYGYATHEGVHEKIPQVGRVRVEDAVELGANTTVDRATLAETRIGEGTKIDNLVQVGHNVRIGRHCLLVAQAGIAGSTRLGDHVVMAGQSGLAGHLELGEGVQVAAKSAVFRSVTEGQVAGIPAVEARRWRRQQVLLARLERLGVRVRELEARLDRLTGDADEGD